MSFSSRVILKEGCKRQERISVSATKDNKWYNVLVLNKKYH